MKFILYFIFVFPALNYGQSLSLKDCIQIGLANNSSLKAALSGKTAAKYSVSSSFGELLPTIGLTGSANRTYFPERETIIFDQNTFQVDTTIQNYSQIISTGISATQKIYDGNRNFNQIKQAKELLQTASYQYHSVEIELIRNIVQRYFDYLKAKELNEVASQNLVLSEKQLELVQTQFELGAVKKTDLLKGEVTQGQAQSNLLQSKLSLRKARRNFYLAMGVDDHGETIQAFNGDIQNYPLPSEDNLETIIEKNNPTLAMRRSQINSAKLNFLIAKGMKKPTIDAGVNYSVNGYDSKEWMDNLNDDWTLGLNVSFSIPIFTGNRLTSQMNQKRVEWNQSQEDYTAANEALIVQALDNLDMLNQIIKRLPIQIQVVEAAREDLTLAQERYSLGAASILEVLDAQVSFNQAKTSWVNMKHDFWISVAFLKALTGDLNEHFGNN